jgi:hypothetical protein
MGRKAHNRIEYSPGDVVGPHGVKFIAERPDRIASSGYKTRTVLAECPSCLKSWEVQLNNLRSGASSCCTECGKKKAVKNGAALGHNRATHGLTCIEPGMNSHPLCKTWEGIANRCLNPNASNYASYGGRGIQLYKYWQGPLGLRRFARAMGDRPSPFHSIDRINPNRNYDPFNCQWKSTREQFNNKRNTRRIMWKGEERSLADIADLEGMIYGTLQHRLKLGMSIEAAINKPLGKGRRPESTLTYQGETLTLTEWSKITGIPRLVLQSRKGKDWPVECIPIVPLTEERMEEIIAETEPWTLAVPVAPVAPEPAPEPPAMSAHEASIQFRKNQRAVRKDVEMAEAPAEAEEVREDWSHIESGGDF